MNESGLPTALLTYENVLFMSLNSGSRGAGSCYPLGYRLAPPLARGGMNLNPLLLTKINQDCMGETFTVIYW